MNLAEFHESVLRTAFGSSEEKSALPLCCCVLTFQAPFFTLSQKRLVFLSFRLAMILA